MNTVKKNILKVKKYRTTERYNTASNCLPSSLKSLWNHWKYELLNYASKKSSSLQIDFKSNSEQMSLEVSVNMFFSLEFHCTDWTDFVRVSSIRSGLESYESGLKIIEFGKVLQRLCLKKIAKTMFFANKKYSRKWNMSCQCKRFSSWKFQLSNQFIVVKISQIFNFLNTGNKTCAFFSWPCSVKKSILKILKF